MVRKAYLTLLAFSSLSLSSAALGFEALDALVNGQPHIPLQQWLGFQADS